VTDRTAPVDLLRSLARVPDAAFDLAGGALALAALGNPEAALEPYRTHLADLAADVGRAVRDAASAAGKIEALATAIHLARGYTGDSETYDDLRNANLMQVIDRRKGLPVALGILYLHGARAQGWETCGLSFPGHFLIRLDHGSERVIVDPFNGGRTCAAPELRELMKRNVGTGAELSPEHYVPVADREVLLRLQNNVKSRHLKAGRLEDALISVEAMLLFAPDATQLWRESGILNAQIGRLAAAVAALEQYAERAPLGEAKDEAARLIAGIRRRLN
jgi:regulator of sirC expression with transglutaminase-like and TPR domain